MGERQLPSGNGRSTDAAARVIFEKQPLAKQPYDSGAVNLLAET